jgi:hypothetical protein
LFVGGVAAGVNVVSLYNFIRSARIALSARDQFRLYGMSADGFRRRYHLLDRIAPCIC